MNLVVRSSILIGALSALTISAAWWIPGSVASVFLGWITVFLLVILAQRCPRPYRASYVSGFLIHPLAFYWLFTTIETFGNFDWSGAAGIFFVFAALSGLQYPLFIFLVRGLPSFFDGAGLRTAIAWTVAEFMAVRIFPWSMGHSQLAFVPFAQAAALGGAHLISFLMFWMAESILQVRWKKAAPSLLAFPGILIVACCIFGFVQTQLFHSANNELQKVSLIQANIKLDEKHAVELIQANLDKYMKLSRNALAKDTLIIWPESVIVDFIPDSVGSAINEPRLPYWQGSESSFLIGALTFRSQHEFYNSAVAIFRDGTVPPPYHKQILMPFGEYTPFGDTFPWLRQLDGLLGEFSPGKKTGVFNFPISNTSQSTLAVAPLICYEDVLPGLSRDAVANGAQLLVNLTNDAWFGISIAPLQHHLIASFRAIEQHRYLLRATNTGFTAIVNPLGQTIASLPENSEGVLNAAVMPFSDRTIYSAFGDLLWWALTAFTVILIVITAIYRRVVKRRSAK